MLDNQRVTWTGFAILAMFVDTLTHLQQKFDFVVGVEMTKKRLSTFYMLQNLQGEPLPGFIRLEVQRVYFIMCFRKWPKLLQEKLH